MSSFFDVTKSPYNDEVRNLDEQILKLIQERREKTEGKLFFPPDELRKQWTKEFGLKESEVAMFLQSFNYGSSRAWPGEDTKGELHGVLPIMKKHASDEWEMTITHAMQYEKASEVHVGIIYKNEERERVNLRVDLMLHVRGGVEYVCRFHGGGGGRGILQWKYLVTPRLPDDLSDIQFGLVPHVIHFHPEEKVVVLDQPVEFD